jgi:hypothetical protein
MLFGWLTGVFRESERTLRKRQMFNRTYMMLIEKSRR